jgi:hypothetical protein
MSARTLRRAWLVVGASWAAVFVAVLLAWATGLPLFAWLGPALVAVALVSVPVAVVMTVIRAVALSAARRRAAGPRTSA